MQGITVLPLFDGISCGRIALERAGIPVVYDFVYDIAYLVRAYKKRCTTYRKNGCYFVEGD